MTATPAQHEAIWTNAEKVAVASGPGSGKTYVLVERAKRLIAQGRVVILITFTNRGAQVMRSRLGDDYAAVKYCGPLHKFCYRMLREFGAFLGYQADSISILPEREKTRLLKQICGDLGFEVTQKELLAQNTDAARQIWREYDDTLRRNNMVDFDKILANAARLLDQPMVRESYRCDDLLIDEAQDSAAIDWLIYMKLPAARRFIVADVDQSIFVFRGGFSGAFVELTKLPDWQTIALTENFRSWRTICAAASKLIAYNENRVPKDTVSVFCDRDGMITVRSYSDVWMELGQLSHLVRSHLERDESAAVLCRSNYEANRVIQYFRSINLPTNQEQAIYKPMDWDLAVTCIGIACAPNNSLLVERFLRFKGVPELDITKFRLRSLAEKRPLMELAAEVLTLDNWRNFSNLSAWLQKLGVGEATANFIIQRMDELEPGASMEDLLHDLNALRDNHASFPEVEPEGVEESKTHVYIGTIHSAKGHEWDVVFLQAFEEGIIPHHGKHEPTQAEMEEERRLAYVAVTRARQAIYITTADNRTNQWGPPVSRAPSRFIAEMGLTEENNE